MSLNVKLILKSMLLEIKIPTPLEFDLELNINPYFLPDPPKNVFLRSDIQQLLFSLMSDRKIMSVFKSNIAFTFLSCFGQDVETLRELQFCIPIDKVVRIPPKSSCAVRLPAAPLLSGAPTRLGDSSAGDRNTYHRGSCSCCGSCGVHIHLLFRGGGSRCWDPGHQEGLGRDRRSRSIPGHFWQKLSRPDCLRLPLS